MNPYREQTGGPSTTITVDDGIWLRVEAPETRKRNYRDGDKDSIPWRIGVAT